MTGGRVVAVAVDAAGVAGGRTYSYHVPERLADLALGEAVLVGYGRRQALGIVLAEEGNPPPGEIKPILERVRSDGPLLPVLQLELARWIAAHYLAPPAIVLRAMLPPGFLERLELVAYPGRSRASEEEDALAAAVTAAGPGGISVRDLGRSRSRPDLLRELNARASRDELSLAWVLQPRRVRPRLERVALLTPEGRATAEALARGVESRRGSRVRLGPRQRSALLELLDHVRGEGAVEGEGVGEGVPAARLAERHGAAVLKSLERRGLAALDAAVRERRPFQDRTAPAARSLPAGVPLTAGQAAAVGRVVALMREGRHAGILLDGVTASGKTAVYAAAIVEALRLGRSALLLVPEIALALPLLDRLREGLGIDVALLHSALGEGERSDEWARIRAGDVRVVVGTRIAVTAPLANPGLVVVDEEHDAAYKSDRTPRLQARDVALQLGRMASVPVLLGSATPDVVSVGRAESGELERFRLPERASGRAPSVELVDLREELASGNARSLSRGLQAALQRLDLSGGERAILLMNRRGSASVVLCRDCGYVQICPECQRPLVFHAVGMALRCHHCGATAPVARRCPACASPRIRYLGGGTERVEQEVRELFPALRVGRLDRDVVERKGAAARVIDAFTQGDLNVLVGTSLVAKGIDVPSVTLVGVVSADIALNLPDERAAERTFQLLAQAVGRAGRGDRPGHAVIQTYRPEHPAVQAVALNEPDTFYTAELAARRRFGAPPFGELLKLTVALADRERAEREGETMASRLRERARDREEAVEILGPAPAYIVRRGGRWRFNVVLRGQHPVSLLEGDPGSPWSVDVDPESLL